MPTNSASAPPPLYTHFDISTRGRVLQVLTAVFGAISITLIALRIAFRASKRIMGWDDWIMLLTLVLLIPQMSFTFLEIPQGAGSHIAELGVLQIAEQLKWVYITEVFLFLILCSTKVSICLFVLRLKKADRRLNYFLYALISGIVVTTMPVFIVWFAQCQPLHSFWDGNLTTKCWDQTIYNNLIWLQVAFSIFGDLSCSILPIVILYKIRVPLNLKIAVCGLTLIGLVATAAGIVRATMSPSNMITDLTHDLALISIWATVEIHLGIIGANMALMRMIYVFFTGRSQTTKDNSQYSNYYASRQRSGNTWRITTGRSSAKPSTSDREEDEYPLEGSIYRTTDYVVSSEPTALARSHV